MTRRCEEPIRILFICHGNICRSPMAEFVLKSMIKAQGVEDRFVVASCATSTEEIWDGVGNPVYPPAREELAKHGITCKGKRAVQLLRSDYDHYDLLVVMDQNNLRNTLRIVGDDPQQKIHRLMEYAGGGDVADPWYSRRFDVAYRDIERGCAALLQTLLAENGINSL